MKSIQRVVSALSLMLFCALSLGAAAAQASGYQYTYTGKPFTTTATSFDYNYPPPYDVTAMSLLENITVDFVSPTLLTGPVNLYDTLPYRITINNITDNFSQALPYPYPNQSPGFTGNQSPGSPQNPYYQGTFNILSTDSAGLPTGWDISVDYTYAAPTGRLFQTFVSTATNLDQTYGGYEGFYSYLGTSINNGGTWTVSAVPEIQSYIMLLLGLATVVMMARRQYR